MMNSVSDIYGIQDEMPRIVGLAYASKLYRNNKNLSDTENFSIKEMRLYLEQYESKYSEGHFWEAINHFCYKFHCKYIYKNNMVFQYHLKSYYKK